MSKYGRRDGFVKEVLNNENVKFKFELIDNSIIDRNGNKQFVKYHSYKVYTKNIIFERNVCEVHLRIEELVERLNKIVDDKIMLLQSVYPIITTTNGTYDMHCTIELKYCLVDK